MSPKTAPKISSLPRAVSGSFLPSTQRGISPYTQRYSPLTRPGLPPRVTRHARSAPIRTPLCAPIPGHRQRNATVSWHTTGPARRPRPGLPHRRGISDSFCVHGLLPPTPDSDSSDTRLPASGTACDDRRCSAVDGHRTNASSCRSWQWEYPST